MILDPCISILEFHVLSQDLLTDIESFKKIATTVNGHIRPKAAPKAKGKAKAKALAGA